MDPKAFKGQTFIGVGIAVMGVGAALAIILLVLELVKGALGWG